MTTFVYKAKKGAAETVTGQVTAQSQDEAVELITQLGLLPVFIEIKSDKEISVFSGKPRKIKNKEVYVFTRQLANLIKAGISILRALAIIEEQTENIYLKKIISQVGLDIKNGKSLSEGLFRYPQIFSPLYLTLIRAGEEGGNLQEMLVNLALYLRKQEETLSKVRTAFAYPILMGGVGIFTVYFILSYVLPKMSGLFENISGRLPLPTVILLEISHALSVGWYWILLGVFIVFLSLVQFFKSHLGRLVLSRFFLRLPGFGQIILKVELARFCRTLELLLRGVPIIRSIQIAIPLLSNKIIQEHFEKCKNALNSGGSFGQSIKQSKEIPIMLGHLISVGEETGNLNEVLKEVADTYEQDTEEAIKILTTLLEPLMILVIGGVVGFIVFSLLLPVFQLDILSN